MKKYIITGVTGSCDVQATKGNYGKADLFYQFADAMGLTSNYSSKLDFFLLAQEDYIRGLIDAYDFLNRNYVMKER